MFLLQAISKLFKQLPATSHTLAIDEYIGPFAIGSNEYSFIIDLLFRMAWSAFDCFEKLKAATLVTFRIDRGHIEKYGPYS